MDSAKVWRLILLRGIWFMVAIGLILLGLIVAIEGASGRPTVTGTEYAATITGKASVAPNPEDGTVCRVTVDPTGAPAQSDAPTRLRSTTACAQLPNVGQSVRLTYLDDGRTVLTDDATGTGRGLPTWLGAVLVLLGAAVLVLFVRADRAFTRALDEVAAPA